MPTLEPSLVGGYWDSYQAFAAGSSVPQSNDVAASPPGYVPPPFSPRTMLTTEQETPQLVGFDIATAANVEYVAQASSRAVRGDFRTDGTNMRRRLHELGDGEEGGS